MATLYYVLGFLLFLIEEADAAYCKSYDYYSTTYIYCRYGCCGSSYNRYCCGYTNIPLYVGLSVGGFFLLIIIIASICACVKSGTKSGRVVRPTTRFMTVSSTVQRSQPRYSGHMPQPPPYSASPPMGVSSGQYPPAYPHTGFHPPPGGFSQPPSGYHPPPAPLQGNPPPPPEYNAPSAPQAFTYSNP